MPRVGLEHTTPAEEDDLHLRPRGNRDLLNITFNQITNDCIILLLNMLEIDRRNIEIEFTQICLMLFMEI
jgi:hypothetical protein